MSLPKGIKRGSYKPKEKKFLHICESCKKEFNSADVKGRFCEKCKLPRQCKCGCGTLVKTPGKLFAKNCQKRGKSYFEIYGEKGTKSGFKKGSENPSKNVEVLKKIWSSVKKKNIEYEGLKFSNNYELKVYKKIREQIPLNNIRYENFLYCNEDVFIPDFLIFNNEGILTSINEISGFASVKKEGRQRNIEKLKKIRKCYKEQIINFIAPKNLLTDYIEQLKNEKINFIEYEKFLKDGKANYYKEGEF